MFTVKFSGSKLTPNFVDSYYDVTNIPMTNNNTLTISDALNDPASIYGDEGFSPKPNGSSYQISVRGHKHENIFHDFLAIEKYIADKLKTCIPKLEKRNV